MKAYAGRLRVLLGKLNPCRNDPVWYVAYGSNIDPRGVQHYLDPISNRAKYFTRPTTAPIFTQQDLVIPHHLYFAGTSKHWQGPVAFISAEQDATAPTIARAFLITRHQLRLIVGKENGLQYPTIPRLPAPGFRTIQLPEDPTGRRYKYNALIRLADIQRLPAYTLSTAKALPRGTPSAAYVSRLATGIGQILNTVDRNAYLAKAIARSQGDTMWTLPPVPAAKKV